MSTVLFGSITGPGHSGDAASNGGYKAQSLWVKLLRQDERVELVHEVHCSTVWRKKILSSQPESGKRRAKKAKKPAKLPRAPSVSVVIPSMGRAERLASCVKTLFQTVGKHTVECIVVIDCDRESVLAVEGLPKVKVLFNEERRGAIACWNQGLAKAKGDILVFGNDDCVWQDGWLDAALWCHQEELDGYGLVGFNDGYQDGNVLAVHYLFDRQFCVDHLGGVMAYPHYHFYCNDTEANARAKLAGRFCWCKLAVVQHNHWTRPGGGQAADALDYENSAKSVHDIAEFERRKALGFPNDFEAVLK